MSSLNINHPLVLGALFGAGISFSLAQVGESWADTIEKMFPGSVTNKDAITSGIIWGSVSGGVGGWATVLFWPYPRWYQVLIGSVLGIMVYSNFQKGQDK